MATEVIMPKVDMVMDEGTFVEWLKEEGAPVKKGEPLFIILTDKANIEIEAPASGVLAGVRAQPGDEIPVTEVIAYILEPDEPLPAGAETRPAAAPLTDAPTGARTAPRPEAVTSPVVPPGAGAGKVRATPVARRLAAEIGIDLAQVKGRGPRGRIHKADVLAFAERQPVTVEPGVAAASVAPLRVPLPDARQKEVVPLAGPRKIIADRMAYSAFTAPHITLSLRVDMSEAARLRARLLEPLRAKTGQRLSFTAILARAVAAGLPRHPYLNASLDGEEIVLWDDVHLGIAMSVDDYLIVPVVREAQNKNLEQIVTDLGDLTERARTKRLVPSEMAGSTFTISNLGMFGVESFTAIVNPPESAILAVGKIVDTPVAAGEGIVLRPMMCLTICVDHRVVDGAAAARFLAELKDTLENPYLLI
jgi:pyruvate dehydrogenase E2 component (dihydrolipoamide acetyltransferase)